MKGGVLFKDLSGQRFGKLAVVRYAGANNGALWECRCDCGVTRIISARGLKSGDYRSCGCGRKLHPVKHSLSRSPEYRAAAHAEERCRKAHHKSYQRYGGRGIEFRFGSIAECAEYIVRVLGRRPDGMTLDRIDNNGHYQPGNLRWATRSQQQRNKQP